MRQANRSGWKRSWSKVVLPGALVLLAVVMAGNSTPGLSIGYPPDQDTPTPGAPQDTATPGAPQDTPTPTGTPDETTSLLVRDAYGRINIYLPFVARSPGEALAEPISTPKPKKTRAPKPTEAPKWPPPLAQPGRSKLGIHIVRNNSPDIMEFIRVTKPAVVKAVDDLHWLIEVKEASPKTVTIGRINVANQDRVGNPEEAARAFVAANLEKYKFNSGVDYWEGWNEPDPGPEMGWYARFEAERARQMAAHGLRVAVGGFSAGVPEWNEFVAFLPAIEAAKRYGGILSLHEYGAPTMDYLVGAGIPGRSARPDRGALALRYRFWYEDLLKPLGLAIPLVISEAGIDGPVNPTGPKGLGWKDFVRYWSTKGMGEDGEAVYIDQLAWYDDNVQRDGYLIDFTVFTAGAKSGDWVSYDITDILPKIAYYVVAQR